MKLAFTTLDVFTASRFLGNPLAIVHVPSQLRPKVTEDIKQKIANEFNLSETSFLHDAREGEDYAEYDIFTPKSRMTFAGHPTIGTAIYVSQNPSRFPGLKNLKTVAGIVPFSYDLTQRTVEVAIPHNVYLHAQKLLQHPYPEPETNPTGQNTVPLVSIVKGMAFNLVQVSDLETLGRPTSGLIPVADLYKGEYLDEGSGWDVGYTGTFYFVDLGIVGGPERRSLRTRSLGSREDPGTGSASAALCCYLALNEDKAKGQGPFLFHLMQGVEMGRQCDIFVQVTRKANGEEIEEVRLKGGAVEAMDGVITVDIE